jgi:hypothetical protein
MSASGHVSGDEDAAFYRSPVNPIQAARAQLAWTLERRQSWGAWARSFDLNQCHDAARL